MRAVQGSKHLIGTRNEDSAGIGEPQPAPRGFQQSHARLTLQDLQLLGHRRRCQRHRFGRGMDRPAFGQFPQKP